MWRASVLDTLAMRSALNEKLTELYTGSTLAARWFRIGLIIFDLATIVLFIALVPFDAGRAWDVFGLLIGLLIFMDLAARLWIADDRRDILKKLYVIADIIVIISLIAAPFVQANLAFLRILRGLRIIHSYHLLQDLRRYNSFFLRHEDAVIAAVNLFVFVFFTTSVVFVLFVDVTEGFGGYVDALYFTVSTLTTTGYGDITPTTITGKLASVGVMVVGVALFVQLARAVIMPVKVTYECTACGLMKHERDAVHCKHCGQIIHIQTVGQ